MRTTEELLAAYQADPRSSNGMNITEFDQLCGMEAGYGLRSIYEVIAKRQVTLFLLNGKKLDNSLYLTTERLNNFFAEDDSDDVRIFATLFNPYFYALKRNAQFRNKINEELINIIFQFLFLKAKEIFNTKSDIDCSRLELAHISRTKNPGFKQIAIPIAFAQYVDEQLLDSLIEYAQQYYRAKDYYQMPQNERINAVIKAETSTLAQLDLYNTGIIEVNKNFKLYIENYEGPLSNNARKFFDILLMQIYKNPQNGVQVRFSLEEYRQYRNFSSTRIARKSALSAMAELRKLSYEAVEVIRRKNVPSGHISLYGGTALIENGIIKWNFNQDFERDLEKRSYLMDINKKCFTFDDHKNPNSYNIARFIDLNYRVNEGTKRVNKISINAMIDNCPDLKSQYQSIQPRRYKEKIMTPFLRDLYHACQAMDYFFDIVDSAERLVDDPYSLSFREFERCYLVIDYSEHPQNKERIARKTTYKNRIKSGTKGTKKGPKKDLPGA